MSQFVAQDQTIDTQPSNGSGTKRLRRPSEHKPCDRCKTQHLKCVYPTGASKCQRCERSGTQCIGTLKKIRFRDIQMSDFSTERKHRRITSNSDAVVKSLSSVNVAQSDNSGETPYSGTAIMHEESTKVGDGTIAQAAISTDVNRSDYGQTSSITGSGERLPVEDPFRSVTAKFLNGHAADEVRYTENFGVRQSSNNTPLPGEGHRTHFEHNQGIVDHPFGTEQFSVPSFSNSSMQSFGEVAPTTLLEQMVKSPRQEVMNDSQRYLETILLRYFHEELAPWFDICDPFHHFADILPQKSRERGPLRSALLTISSRNLSHNHMFRSTAGVPQWKGHILSELTAELAITYHNECIRELLQLSLDHKKLYDETLLAAVVILRTDEEMLHEVEDKQLFLRISSLFIDAQVPAYLALPRTSPQIGHTALDEDTLSPPIAQVESELGSSGLRQACFWTALRQDLYAAFLKQQSVKFPLLRCEAFRQLSPANDAVWANRMVVFCADALEFCYGSESIDAKVLPAYTDRERWRQLRSHEESLLASLPSSFEPTYCREPIKEQNEMFPSLFYLEAPQVSGTSYVELARMLLEVFNPVRPKLGHGCIRATKAFVIYTKKILFRLCGIALSNCDICPPSLINASLGIALFGEYIEDPNERSALLGVLSLMTQRYNYYTTAQIANSLKQAWSSDLHEDASPSSVHDIYLS